MTDLQSLILKNCGESAYWMMLSGFDRGLSVNKLREALSVDQLKRPYSSDWMLSRRIVEKGIYCLSYWDPLYLMRIWKELSVLDLANNEFLQEAHFACSRLFGAAIRFNGQLSSWDQLLKQKKVDELRVYQLKKPLGYEQVCEVVASDGGGAFKYIDVSVCPMEQSVVQRLMNDVADVKLMEESLAHVMRLSTFSGVNYADWESCLCEAMARENAAAPYVIPALMILSRGEWDIGLLS